jgi:parallel beta-helix repeat protein
MRTFNIVKAFVIPFVIVFTAITFAQQSNNKAFVFDGQSNPIYVKDGNPVIGENPQSAFQYFNAQDTPATDNNITVQAWIYLIGENTSKMPIIYRSVEGGSYNVFSLYVDADRKAYFSINSDQGIKSVSTPKIPAFTWIQLTGIYDTENQELKIYFGKDLAGNLQNVSLGAAYENGQGLYIGRSGTDAFKGLIDEIRLWNIALGENNINGSGGNGNPAEPYPSSLEPYLAGQWSFNDIGNYDGTAILEDLSDHNNHLRVEDEYDLVDSKHLPFFVVTSIGDEGDEFPGDGNATSTNGEVTLRSAIQEANELAGQQTIYFYITETAPIIQTFAELPHIIQPVILDGTFQSGYHDNPQVQVQVIDSYGGLTISGGGSTLQGLAISTTSGFGLTLTDLGSNNIIENKINGIYISSPDNNITNNTFSNSSIGVEISDGAQGTVLSDNTISVNTVGLALNTSNYSLSEENTIKDNTGSGITGNGIVINGSGNHVSNQIIFNNDNSGVFVKDGIENSILNNSIYSNDSGLGIELNDATSANYLQASPVLSIFYTWQNEENFEEGPGKMKIILMREEPQ